MSEDAHKDETPRKRTQEEEELLATYDHIVKERIDGINYQQWLTQDPPRVVIEKMANTKMRASDVVTIGFPRSGNHWTYEVIHMVLNQTTQFAKRPFVDILWDFMNAEGYKKLEESPSPRLLMTHSRPRRIPKEAAQLGCKIILILRNPKDAIRSFFLHYANFVDPTLAYKGTWDQFLQLYMMGEIAWGNWFDHTLVFEKFMKEHPDVPVHVHSYEEMIKDPMTSVKKLCKFLGKPDTLAGDIVAAASFGKMKAHEGINKIDEQLFGKDSSCSLVRKGVIGDWKSQFTVAQSEQFNRVFEKKMAGSKLADYVREYI